MTRRERLWNRLNEPFVIWALSTVVVGVFGAAYSEFNSRLVRQQEEKRVIERLQMQAGVRLEYTAELAKVQAGSRLLLDTFLMDTSETRIDKDFEGRTTLAILFELRRLCGLCGTSADRDQRMRDLIGEAMILRSRLLQNLRQPDDESIAPRVHSIVEQLLSL